MSVWIYQLEVTMHGPSANYAQQDIASLLQHLSAALRALATPPGKKILQEQGSESDSPSDSDTSNLNDTPPSSSGIDPVTVFKTAQNNFFRTIDRIDKHLTRQIYALEEAGIITLKSGTGSGTGAAGAGATEEQPQQLPQPQMIPGQPQAAGITTDTSIAPAPKARLEPDGMGRYGKLDVGRLNMASSTVERDMEGELWHKAREHLGRMASQASGGEDRMEE